MATDKDSNKLDASSKDGVTNLGEATLKSEKGEKVSNDTEEKLASESNADILNLKVDIQTLASMLKDYCTGQYKDVPYPSILAITGSLAYYVLPIDLIPDRIPIAGKIDDLAVLSWAIGVVDSDMSKYKEWKEAQKDKISDTPLLDEYLDKVISGGEKERQKEIDRLSDMCSDDSIKKPRLRAEHVINQINS